MPGHPLIKMKNQYFGDTRDLFKYDLINELISKTKPVKNITLLPMLTENDKSAHGSKTDYSRAVAGTDNFELIKFLTACLNKNMKNAGEIGRFFKRRCVDRDGTFFIYKENEYLNANNRNGYFDRIASEALSDAVILVDPDTGIETGASHPYSNKHIKFSEISSLYKKMNQNSVLLIFQFIPRVKRAKYFRMLCSELKSHVWPKQPIIFVSDRQIVFFMLTKSYSMKQAICDNIKNYSGKYGLTYGSA